MAFTIMQGTILKSLFAFNVELERLAKKAKYAKEQNGVVVSTIEGNSLTYHKTEHGQPGNACIISRTVVVRADEEGFIDVFYRLPADEIVAAAKMKFPFITGDNENIINFLIHGTIPHQGL